MKKLSLCWSIGVLLLVITAFQNRLSAKEVEIVVAGPWAFAADPNDPNHVLLIVINYEHKAHFLSGGDVWRWKDANWGYQERDSGYYTALFSTQCTPHANINVKMYPVDKVDVNLRLNSSMSGSGVAISLPKPCWYEEGYIPSHVMLEDDLHTGHEHVFTTIMRLHYTVDDGLTELKFAGLKSPIAFKQVAIDQGITSPAVSIVVGRTSGGPDKKCDKHSADILDRSLDFWGQSRVHRMFPKLNDDGSQLPGQYDSTCKSYTGSAPSNGVHEGLVRADSHGEIRTKSSNDTPMEIRSPSRSDCHVSLFNINGAVQ
jgi:hypothetical protein